MKTRINIDGKETEWYENGCLKEFTEASIHGIVHKKNGMLTVT